MLLVKQREYEQSKYNCLENNYDIDSREIWKHIRSNKQSDQGLYTIKADDKSYSTPEELRLFWCNHFSGILNEQEHEKEQYDSQFETKVNEDINNMQNMFCKNVDCTGVLDKPVNVEEIGNICASFPNNKAAGYDNIPYESLKYGNNALYETLAEFYNSIINLLYVPDGLKTSLIIPLYKGHKKLKSDPNSYRGISLTIVLNKLFEKIILNRLQTFLKSKEFPPALQHAGQKGCSSVTACYLVHEIVNFHTERHGKVFAWMFLGHTKSI